MPEPHLFPRPVRDHRADREAGAVVYPVFSRRSRGLSVGINLFPDSKRCSFDCPYCEVFPFSSDIRFDVEAMERGLRAEVRDAELQGLPIMDFCFSGNGEPTLSEAFPAALERARLLRDELAPDAALVLITNGSTLVDEATAGLLRDAALRPKGLECWIKLDAGTEAWYRRMDRSAVPFGRLVAGIEAFLEGAPAVLQTMVCALDGECPSEEEREAYEALVVRLAGGGRIEKKDASVRRTGVRRVQLYGKARPAPADPAASELPPAFLEARGRSLRAAFARAGVLTAGPGGRMSPVPVEVYP